MHRHTRGNLPPVVALMLVVAALVVALVAAPGFAAPQQQNQSPPTNPFPQRFPDRPNFGPQPNLGINNPGPMLRENQNEMKKDIDQLYAMAQQLKQQSDKTNSTQVLSLGLVHKAKNIEDLAKKIGNLAKGS